MFCRRAPSPTCAVLGAGGAPWRPGAGGPAGPPGGVKREGAMGQTSDCWSPGPGEQGFQTRGLSLQSVVLGCAHGALPPAWGEGCDLSSGGASLGRSVPALAIACSAEGQPTRTAAAQRAEGGGGRWGRCMEEVHRVSRYQ